MLEGRTKEAREWREQPDQWWSDRLGQQITPRWILQYWGTEVCRKGFHDDIWIASVENKLRKSGDNVVISDCRFPNEIASIKSAGGKIVWVQRGTLPHWHDIAVKANRGETSAITWLEKEKIHASEWAWIGSNFDYKLDNNGSIDNLYNQIKNLVTDRPVATVSLPYEELSDSLHTLS